MRAGDGHAGFRVQSPGCSVTETRQVALEKQLYPQPGQPWENTFGMKFVPVPGTGVLFCIWDTRVQDYQAFVNETRREWPKPDFPQGPTYPAVNVSWDDAKAFCRWLTEKERREGRLAPNQEYRLPIDAEWSVAVGLNEPAGGTPQDKNSKIRGVYPWGTQRPPPRGVGNFADEAAKRKYRSWIIIHGYDDGFADTSPVGSFPANLFGLCDMSGNVWQWCEDFYNGSNGSRVVRGGSFRNVDSNFLLSLGRSCDVPGDRVDYIGFRCVLVVSAP
jgi:formylglycine-generating enzyme required for sulfatase activity